MKTPKSHNNALVSVYLRNNGGHSWSEIPSFVDDIITGASRSARGRLPANRGYILAILCDLKEITVEAIRELLYGRHMVRKHRPMSIRQAQEYAAMARLCSDAILKELSKHPELLEELQYELDEDEWWEEQNKDVVPCVNPWGV